MKKIIALLAIVAMSFSAKAAAVSIVNTTGMPISGYFGLVNILNGAGPGGAGWLGGPTVTIPVTGISFANIEAFHVWTMGVPSGPGYTAPAWRLYLTNFYPVGSSCGFYTQNNGTWNIPCSTVPSPFTGLAVTQSITATVTTITIALY